MKNSSYRRVLFIVQLLSMYMTIQLVQGQTDTDPPVFENCPVNVEPSPGTELYPGTQPIKIPDEPSVSDNSGEILNVTSNVRMYGEEGDFHDFEVGVSRIFYNASDAAGNIATCEYTVEVKLAPPMNLWNISINDYNASCVTLIWSQLNRATQYIINYYPTAPDSSDGPSMESVADDGNIFGVFTVCNLSAGMEYVFEVDSTGTSHETYRITQRTKPMAPQDITTISSDPTSIGISWTYPESSTVDQYHVFYHQDGNDDAVVDLGFVPKQKRSYTFEGLHPSVTYVFYVEAIMASGDTRTSNVASHTETTDTIPSDTFIVVTNFTETTITVAWIDMVDSDITDTIVLSIGTTDPDLQLFECHPLMPTLPKYESTYEFIDLKVSTEYKIILTRNGENAVHKTVTKKTRPERIHDLEVRDLNESAIKLSWEDDKNIGNYRILLSPSPNGDEPQNVTRKEEITISGLTQATDYYVQVVSDKDGVLSVPVRRLFRKGENPGPPDEEDPSLFLVYMVAAGAGMFVFILLVVICGLLCLIPCEEEIPPLPPPSSYPGSRENTVERPPERPFSQIRPVSIRMTERKPEDFNSIQHDGADSDYASMIGTYGTYKNMFGKTIKPRGYSLYRKRSTRNSRQEPSQEPEDQADSVSYDSVPDRPEEEFRYPGGVSHTNHAITSSFEALSQYTGNNRLSQSNTTM
ncbi:fibronectin-like isoform X2 [Amphiura filiformis]|uniref:fibronectin-like isoform X2 n=1 Tax=Amphiura filiformis TaxID=82378 RepID=UPI003B220B51